MACFSIVSSAEYVEKIGKGKWVSVKVTGLVTANHNAITWTHHIELFTKRVISSSYYVYELTFVSGGDGDGDGSQWLQFETVFYMTGSARVNFHVCGDKINDIFDRSLDNLQVCLWHHTRVFLTSPRDNSCCVCGDQDQVF